MTTDRATGKVLAIILTAVIGLLSVLIAFQAYQISAVQDHASALQNQINAIPSMYVQKERYACDIGRLDRVLRDINLKLDRVVERGLSSDPGASK